MPFPAGSCTQHSYFIIHPAVFETSIVTKFGRFFHLLFTKKLFHILRQRAFRRSSLPVISICRAFHPDSALHRGVHRHPERSVLRSAAPAARCAPGSRRKGHRQPAGGRWTQNAPVSGGCGPLPGRRPQGSGRFLPLIWYIPSGWACHRGSRTANDALRLAPDGRVDTPGPAAALPPQRHSRAFPHSGPAAARRNHFAARTRPLVSLSMRFTGRKHGAYALTQRPCGIAVRKRIVAGNSG